VEYCVIVLYTKTKTDAPETIEGENLAAHVILCRQRDIAITTRFEEMNDRQDKIENSEKELRAYLLRTITTAALALLSSAVSFGVIISEFVKK
jgi:hypothetical protein